MYSETPFSVEMELSSAGLSVKQPNVTLSVEWLAKLCGIERTSYYRWKKNSVDRRKGANHSNNAVYTEAMDERALKYIKTHPDLNVDELIATCLDQCDEQGRSIGWYLGSRSRVYRLMRKAQLINQKRNGGRGIRHNINSRRLSATAPNQVYVWDITYLYKNIEGEYYYLYAMMDLYSRKMLCYEVHERQSDRIAATFLEHGLQNAGVIINGHITGNPNDDITVLDQLVLHSDNGAPMKGKNMLAKVTELGITTSYSRPLHSNDNAHMESSFATLKHSHSVPIPKSFSSKTEAQQWVNEFYTWYNGEHLHSGIAYITPNDCHAGKGEQILNRRNQIIAEEQQKLGRCIQIKGYALPKKVGLMSFAAKRKQIEKNVKNREYPQGSKQVA